MNADAGGLTLVIGDEHVDISMTGGASWRLPLGPVSLLDRQLERADPPGPAQLTNALAAVHDHFDDIVIESPTVLAAPSVVAVGPHAVALARVEIGADIVPTGYLLRRADAEEVFRTLVAEQAAERGFNPGLQGEHVETIIGTCCVVLAIMRRLDLAELAITDRVDDRAKADR